jgi:hypothetical protein
MHEITKHLADVAALRALLEDQLAPFGEALCEEVCDAIFGEDSDAAA